MSEVIDIFDDAMTLIGTATRDEAHTRGLWHQAFHCWVVRQELGVPYVLFQRRGPLKQVYPNALDITAAGHLAAGESPVDGTRELAEELGISASESDLVSLGIRTEVARLEPFVIREFCHTYFIRYDAPLLSLRLQDSEVSSVVQISIEDGLRLFGSGSTRINVSGVRLTADRALESFTVAVDSTDVIPRLDRYYLKVFIMAERYFAGVGALAI